MARRRKEDPPCLKKYGVPLYAAAFTRSKNHDIENPQYYVVLAGGGGEGRSGIPNAVLLAQFDPLSNSLSPEPVAKLGLGSDLPYRMVVHPGGDGVICAFPNCCRFYEWDKIKEDDTNKLGLKKSEKVLTQLEDIGQQLALAFDIDGSVLALGSEEGNLRVFKWPSMEVILSDAKAHDSVKDLCFSPDGKFLVSVGRGAARVWHLASSKPAASLPKENDEAFVSCRFAQISDNNQVLYIAAMTGKGCSILTWYASSWKKISSKHVFRDSVSSFDVSPDGKLFAIGTSESDVVVISATNMRVHTRIRKAHLGIVTTLSFSKDSRALVSASMDSSARVTLVEDKKSAGGSSLWIVILIVMLAIAAYFMKHEGLLPFLG